MAAQAARRSELGDYITGLKVGHVYGNISIYVSCFMHCTAHVARQAVCRHIHKILTEFCHLITSCATSPPCSLAFTHDVTHSHMTSLAFKHGITHSRMTSLFYMWYVRTSWVRMAGSWCPCRATTSHLWSGCWLRGGTSTAHYRAGWGHAASRVGATIQE